MGQCSAPHSLELLSGGVMGWDTLTLQLPAQHGSDGAARLGQLLQGMEKADEVVVTHLGPQALEGPCRTSWRVQKG